MSKEKLELIEEEKKVVSKYFEIRMKAWFKYIEYLDPKGILPIAVNELIKAGFLNGYAVGNGIEVIIEDRG